MIEGEAPKSQEAGRLEVTATLPLPIPYRCIWCKRTRPEVSFDTASHALPASTGNAEEVLPPGVVCDTCNRNWRKIEQELREFWPFKIGAWAVRSENVYTGKPFCPVLRDDTGTVIPFPKQDGFRLGIRVNGQILHVEVTAAGVKGTFETRYDERRLRLLSRAVHKVAFEGLAWGMYVPHDQATGIVDPHSPHFDHLRAWAQRGEPQQESRPFLAPASFNAAVDLNQVTFGPRVHASSTQIIVQYRDGFAWYAVALLGTPDQAVADLLRWSQIEGHRRALTISDRFTVVNL